MRQRLLAALAAALCAACTAIAQPAAPAADHRAIVEAAARSRYVLLGESTHGTHEYYLERARITEALIRDHDVRAVAIEGDWSGAERLNRYVRGEGSDATAAQALSGFDEFPVWMWRNEAFRDFAERLRAINLQRPPQARVGVYGLDVYDMFDAADAVTAYLAGTDPVVAERVRRHYRCLARFRRSGERYARAIAQGARSCKAGAEAALGEVRALPPASSAEAEARFAILRAAATVVGGEEYFRVQVSTGYSWNARDRRMAEGARQVAAHVGGKVVIWAHNTHVGDARETSMRERGELSLGQLLRDDGGAFLVGFLTAGGHVLAADAWDRPPRVHVLKPALQGSHEAILAAQGERQVRIAPPSSHAPRRLQRAVGVVYAPRSERQSHYMEARLDRQFDAVVFIRETRALTPLR